MSVEFEDYSLRVIEALNDGVIKGLTEAAVEIHAEAVRNTKPGKVNGGKTKGDWKYIVDDSELVATIGNTNENAIWEEFGTGEWALKGNGHRGGWYIPIGNGKGQIPQEVVDAYGFKVVGKKNGQKFAFTRGKKPKKMLQNAFLKKKGIAVKLIEKAIKEAME